MHIDHSQFLELLSETSGIEAEKVTKQIGELLKEINQAIEDGEAFEVDGFGIFSGIGNRILFIPSKELETEINFKYVGMEPIELEENQVTKEKAPEEDPFSGLQEIDSETESKRDPFAGLVEDFEQDPTTEEDSDGNLIFGVESTKRLDKEGEEHQPGPDEWGIEAHKEDDKGANKLLSSLMGEEFSEPEQEEETVEETSFEDIFGENEEEKSESESEESISDLDDELSSLMSEDTSVIPESEMEAGIIDEDLTDIFGEEEVEPNEVSVPEAAQKDESEEPDVKAVDEALDELISEDEELVEEESEPESEKQEDIDLEDFDDPFLDLEEELSEDIEEEKAEDIVPVITNISSGIEPVKKEEPKPKKEKPQKPKKESQPAPVWLWIVLVLVLLTGTTVGLGYFSIINIPGITPQIASNTTVATPPPVIPPVQEESTAAEQPPTAIEPEEVSTYEVTPPPPEQEEVVEVPVLNNTTEVPVNQNKYGMTGVVNGSANDGYTIVLYSLSVEANAFAKQLELTEEGYRSLVTPIASEQYGTLWRVSIGQFANLIEAAIASEGMDAKFKQSYFIKKITN
ncbi:MAG: hypothetical protein BalsKO_30160 [Balneolaceae bacterium]